MERQENAMVAPATLFMGLTVLVVAGAAIYYFTREKEETDAITGGGTDNGEPDNGVPDNGDGELAPGIVATNEWNTSMASTNVVAVEKNRPYNTGVVLPAQLASPDFDVNTSGGVEVLEVGIPEMSNIPNAGATLPLSFKATGDGSIELVWPKGAVPGQDILTQYRRLNVVVGAMA